MGANTRNVWQSLAYSPLDAEVSPIANTNETHLLITALPSSSVPCWTYLKSPQKNFCRRLYNFLCLTLRNYWTESHQIFTRCIEMIAVYSAEIKTAIFQSISERQGDKCRLSSNCGRIAARIAHFNSINSNIIRQTFTEFVHDVVGLLPFNILKAAVRSANPLLNAKAKSNWRCLRISPKFNWLP